MTKSVDNAFPSPSYMLALVSAIVEVAGTAEGEKVLSIGVAAKVEVIGAKEGLLGGEAGIQVAVVVVEVDVLSAIEDFKVVGPAGV